MGNLMEDFILKDTITRAEFVKVINRMFGLTTLVLLHSDVPDGYWANEIDIAVTNGVAQGDGIGILNLKTNN